MARQVEAFVSCSFNKDDEDVVRSIVTLIGRCGIQHLVLNNSVESGLTHDVITEAIRRCGLFVAIVTKRGEPLEGEKTRTAPMIIQEIGIAAALGKQIVIFLEECVDEADLGLARDMTYIPFRRSEVISMHNSKGSVSGNLFQLAPIGERMERLLVSARQRWEKGLKIIDEYEVLREARSVNKSTRERPRRTLPVRQLAAGDPSMGDATFMQGLAYLHDQLLTEPVEFRPDAFVGINSTGAMMGAYLNGRLYRKDQRPIRMLPTTPYREGAPRLKSTERVEKLLVELKKELFGDRDKPGEPQRLQVLLLDSQVKTGESSQEIIKEITDTANQPRLGLKLDLYYAVLVATHVNVDSKPNDLPLTMESLFRPPINSIRRKEDGGHWPDLGHWPDFLAFICADFIKPPYGLP